jgi:hypothetical protein
MGDVATRFGSAIANKPIRWPRIQWGRPPAKNVLKSAVIALWAKAFTNSKFDELRVRRPVPAESTALSDNVQIGLNLILPLKDNTVAGLADVVQVLAESQDEIVAALASLGTVHHARFVLIERNLCVFTIYDGEFSGYLRNYAYTLGPFFDRLLKSVKDAPHTPVRSNIEEFIAWVAAHDAVQIPPSNLGSLNVDFTVLQRTIAVLLHNYAAVELGEWGAYSGYSAAQIRNNLGIGW